MASEKHSTGGRDGIHRRSSHGDSIRSASNSPNSSFDSGSPKRDRGAGSPIEKPILVYHESARSIVFRDHVRRAVKKEQQGDWLSNNGNTTVTKAYVTELMDANRDSMDYTPPDDMIAQPELPSDVKGRINQSQRNGFVQRDEYMSDVDTLDAETTVCNSFQPMIQPLSPLPLGATDQFDALLNSPSGRDGDVDPDWTQAEKEVVDMLANQQAVVKTIKNTEWTFFLHRFQIPNERRQHNFPFAHDDLPPAEDHPHNSFVTSCSLLPPYGLKMRAYGSPSQYTTGVVFALPKCHFNEQRKTPLSEQKAAERTKTWSWPSGYSAKSEFNIDSRGNLINGRQEALVPLSTLRQYNNDYLTKEDHMIAGRLVKGGLNVVPYNEVYMRVGGLGRVVAEKDAITEETHRDEIGNGRSFDRGIGLPVALFVRTCEYGHLVSMIRTKQRLLHVFGEKCVKHIPLLFIHPDQGLRVFTESLQGALLKIASHNLNPFQNPTIAHRTTVNSTDSNQLEQKLEELIDLDDNIRKLLTPEECARLAGGFGVTDGSVATLLKEAMLADKKMEDGNQAVGESSAQSQGHMLQDIVNEGLAAAVRSGDYYTSRQLLILYSLVASKGIDDDEEEDDDEESVDSRQAHMKLLKEGQPIKEVKQSFKTLSKNLSPPPPPPLDTDRLRSATNSDGLLAVLGAAQVLKAMQDGGAKKRTEEVVLALEEWIEHGEQSMAFRLASWRDQRTAQGDLKIATDSDASFMAFVSNKAISNRRAFVGQLKAAVQATDFSDVRFLAAIEALLSKMHSPALRLELLQYVLGLDNRYSVAHVARSVELAKTCLGIAR